MSRTLRIATCQHAVSADINANLKDVIRLARQAKSRQADIVHFSECNLSGYAGTDFHAMDYLQYRDLQKAIVRTQEIAKQLDIWIIVGSHHYDVKKENPSNSLYLINPEGEIAERYDKRYLANREGDNEPAYYTPGNRTVIFELKGVYCGMLICHEWRFPELYREYYQLKADILFQSWYDGNHSREDYLNSEQELGDLIVGTVRGNAASNYLWISGANTSRRESSFPSFMVQPDGRILHKLSRNRSGILISDIDFDRKYPDPSAANRAKILEGKY